MNSIIRKLAWWLMPAALGCSAAALAQDKAAGYPVRPIRIIIAVAPGAGADFMARGAAQLLSDKWGQNAVVDSRPGGGGVVAIEMAARAAPDGYTIMQYGDGMLLMAAQKRVPFDVLKAFDPVVALSAQPYVLIAHVSLPARSIKELVALSAAKPLTYGGGGGVGATVHVGMERFAKVSGMKLKYIAYKGSAPAILALMGGEINMATTSAMAASAAIRSGKVRGSPRWAQGARLPSRREQGVWFHAHESLQLVVPAGTPRTIIAALNQVGDGMHSADGVRLAAEGAGTPPSA